MNDPRNRIRKLVSEHQIEEAIDLLLKFSKTKSKNFENISLALSSRYNSWKQKNRAGSATGMEKNKIISDLLDHIKEDDGPPFPIPPSPSGFLKWLAIAIAFLLISATIIWQSGFLNSMTTDDFFIPATYQKSIKHDTTSPILIHTEILKRLEEKELVFTLQGKGIEKNNKAIIKYMTQQIGYGWDDPDNELYKPEINYIANQTWSCEIWHEIKGLKDGEEFKVMFYKNEFDTRPFHEYHFRVMYSRQ